jgi:putative peptidoglycan lipid II flippase
MKGPWDGILQAATLLLVLEGVSQVAALGKQVLVAAQFGTSSEMDGYLVALAIAWVVRVWVTLPIKQTVIPMFRHDLSQRGEAAAWAQMSVLINNIGVLLLGLAALLALAAPLLVDLVAPGFSAASENLSAWLVRILGLSVVFAGLQGVLSQVYFSYQRFALPGIAGAMENVVVIAVLFALGGRWGVTGLAVATVLGSAVQLVLQLPILWEKRSAYVAAVRFGHPAMTEMRRLSLPLMITSGSAELGRITDRIFASLLAAGSLSALAFAHRLTAAANNLLIDPLQQATFPHFTRLSAEERFATLSRQLFRYLRLILFLATPIAAGLMILADLVVRGVYGRGAFDETSVRLTGQALWAYALGFPALSASRLLSRTFFGLKDTRTPTKVAVGRLAVKLLLCWALVGPMAQAGIALAESVSEIVRALCLFALLPAHVRGGEAGATAWALARTLLATAAMSLALVVARDALQGQLPVPLELAALVGIGAAVYGAITLAVRGDEWESLSRVASAVGARILPSKP